MSTKEQKQEKKKTEDNKLKSFKSWAKLDEKQEIRAIVKNRSDLQASVVGDKGKPLGHHNWQPRC